MFINITKSETGTNTGSCGQLVNYLEKENRLELNIKERWFNSESKDILPHKVRTSIDANIAKLCKSDSKFYLINISPSQKELEYLRKKYGESNIPSMLKEYTEKVMDEYAKNFHRPGVSGNKDILWFGKVEKFRYYGFRDKDVKDGRKMSGERKEGLQYHVQIIVSRKDITNKIKLSPQNNSRGKNVEHSKKLGQFDRTAFKQSGEFIFDEHFGFERSLGESMSKLNAVKNGSRLERIKYSGVMKLISKFPEIAQQAGEIIREIDRHVLPNRMGVDPVKIVIRILNELHWFLRRSSYRRRRNPDLMEILFTPNRKSRRRRKRTYRY